MEMETTHGLNYLVTSNGFGGDGGRGHNNSNCTSSLAWDIRHLGTTSSSGGRYHQYHDWSNNTHNSFTAGGAPPSTMVPDRSSAHTAAALVCQVPHYSPRPGLYYAAARAAGTHNKATPDPHLMCLKLGKRHYFEDGNFISSSSTVPHQLIGDHYDGNSEEAADVSINPKRGKPVVFPYDMVGGTSTTVAVPPVPVARCQVQGCEAMLAKGKEYHRRHKVCEMHSKAPKAMVLGLQQRFCQQCSRFHAISEFDESKRSCRRRLAGHNERRRKSSHDHSLSRIPPQENRLGTGRFPHLPISPTGPALSLLSSKNESWISSSDLSSRCSAALRELIAENRASSFSSLQQLTPDKDWNHHTPEPLLNQTQKNSTHPDQLATNHQQLLHDNQISDRFHRSADANVTLNLAPSSAFGLLSMRDKANKEAEEECSEFWSSLGGTHVV